ncbi:hypothetical protein [Hymenobacter telluris]|nr:hypothetical protein [Hymenobacter telluris]
MSVWQDGRYVAAVLHTQRTILLTRATPAQSGMNPTRLFMLRDSVIQLGTLQQCQRELVGQQQQQHVQLGYSGVLASRLQLKALDFWLGPQNTLRKMSIQYAPTATIRRVTLDFQLQERLTASSKLPVDARTQVLNSQGALLPAYQGYRLVNQIGPAH